MGELRVGVMRQVAQVPYLVAKLDPRVQCVALLALMVAAVVGVAVHRLNGRVQSEALSEPEKVRPNHEEVLEPEKAQPNHEEVLDASWEISQLYEKVMTSADKNGEQLLDAVAQFCKTYAAWERIEEFRSYFTEVEGYAAQFCASLCPKSSVELGLGILGCAGNAEGDSALQEYATQAHAVLQELTDKDVDANLLGLELEQEKQT